MEKLKARDLDKLVGEEISGNAGVILGILAVKERDKGEKYDFQEIDRLINSMLELEWCLVIVCKPAPKQEIPSIRENVYKLYNRLSVWFKRTVQHSVNDLTGISFAESTNDAKDKRWDYNSSKGTNKGVSVNKCYADSVIIVIANKHAEKLMQYIGDNLLESKYFKFYGIPERKKYANDI